MGSGPIIKDDWKTKADSDLLNVTAVIKQYYPKERFRVALIVLDTETEQPINWFVANRGNADRASMLQEAFMMLSESE